MENENEIEQEVFVSQDNLQRFATNMGTAISRMKDANFVYSNDMMQTTWAIHHNLGKKPSVTIVEDYTKKIITADVVITDDNTMTIEFNNAISGKAYLN